MPQLDEQRGTRNYTRMQAATRARPYYVCETQAGIEICHAWSGLPIGAKQPNVRQAQRRANQFNDAHEAGRRDAKRDLMEQIRCLEPRNAPYGAR